MELNVYSHEGELLPDVHELSELCQYMILVDGEEVLDPRAKEVVWVGNQLRGVYRPKSPFNWEGDQPLRLPRDQLVIYEMHVESFAGTFEKVIEKIPYLKDLGITAVELMPIFPFNPTGNFWGYSPLNFFATAPHYGNPREFKELVKAMHKAGIEVLLDVVYNHTGGHSPLLHYTDENYSGCGNTLSCNHPEMHRLIVESLRYWIEEMHVDGFRFDLASILTRGEDGRPLDPSPLIEEISALPTRLIAEAWDAAGLYQVGRFPKWGPWMEWNGPFRDGVRDALKGGGPPTLVQDASSINFITAHDGFTLRDLVSYDQKHNEENGEEDRDGSDDNRSWNCGIEGPTDDPEISNLRKRQMCNFLLALFSAKGTPMLLMGDEVGQSKGGNNNTWKHPTYFDWEATSSPFLPYVKKLISLRGEGESFFNTTSEEKRIPLEGEWEVLVDTRAFETEERTIAGSLTIEPYAAFLLRKRTG